MLELYKTALESARPFDAVIVDLLIADGMGGREAVEKLLEIDPGARAIVSSGYSEGMSLANFRALGFKAVLAKPFSLSALGRVLHEALSQGG